MNSRFGGFLRQAATRLFFGFTPRLGFASEALFLLGIALRTLGETERGDRFLSLSEETDPHLYHDLFTKYAGEVAQGSGSPMMRKALRDAVLSLRERGA